MIEKNNITQFGLFIYMIVLLLTVLDRPYLHTPSSQIKYYFPENFCRRYFYLLSFIFYFLFFIFFYWLFFLRFYLIQSYNICVKKLKNLIMLAQKDFLFGISYSRNTKSYAKVKCFLLVIFSILIPVYSQSARK
jgi:hypothetical protein